MLPIFLQADFGVDKPVGGGFRLSQRRRLSSPASWRDLKVAYFDQLISTEFASFGRGISRACEVHEPILPHDKTWRVSVLKFQDWY